MDKGLGYQGWETPWELFYLLDDQFYFTIDGAADATNTKCKKFITEIDNAHKTELSNEVIFCNPPYRNMTPWADTFIRWSEDNTVVALVQDKTDTAWFAKLWTASTEIRFLTGRVNFIGTQTGNMHGATIFIMGKGPLTKVRLWDWRKELGV